MYNMQVFESWEKKENSSGISIDLQTWIWQSINCIGQAVKNPRHKNPNLSWGLFIVPRKAISGTLNATYSTGKMLKEWQNFSLGLVQWRPFPFALE